MARAADDGPKKLIEPTTGRPILMAPRRQNRPFHTAAADPSTCPFCPGHERETPPEVDAVRRDGSRADEPGWTVRAFPNKYPAGPDHEVVAEGAEHVEHPSEVPVAVWRDVVPVWQRRIRAIEARPGVACAFLFKNVGVQAGASIAHGHSQLLGLSALPPRLVLERDRAAASGDCPWCATLATAEQERRVVAAAAHHVALVPDPPKLPYETWLLPRRCDDDFLATDPASLAETLHALFAAFADGLARPAFNLWLHRVPGAAPGFHWHFELQPRTGHMAALELGADMYINSVPAADAAARLRGDGARNGVAARRAGAPAEARQGGAG